MKSKTQLLLAAMVFIIATKSNAQANESLSNLIAPTAVNQDLLPNLNNARNLGTTGLAWKRLYLSDRLYIKGKIVMQVPGTSNFFVGTSAGNSSVTGSYNTATGTDAFSSITSGSYNTANGRSALYSTTTGNANVAVGYAAMYRNQTGSGNIALGQSVLYNNVSGYSNIAIGTRALYNNVDFNNLLAIGDSALFNQGLGFNYGYNIAIGSKAMYLNKYGDYNTAIGYQAMYSGDGFENTVVGYRALYANTTGFFNSGVGVLALSGNTSGGNNTGLGFTALNSNITGFGNTAIGSEADVMFTNLNNATAIGSAARVDASNKVRIGNTLVTSIGGQVGWTIFSDGRYKKNVKEDVPGLAFINSLRPVTYSLDVDGIRTYFKEGKSSSLSKHAPEIKSNDEATSNAAKLTYTGFVAQEVEAAAKKLDYDFSGVDVPQSKDGIYGLRYDNFVAPLVKAVQELSAINKAKDEQMAAQDKKIDDLQKQLNELKSMLVAQGNASSAVSSSIAIDKTALEQNVPNPFSKTTTISYTLPQKFNAAKIVITDASGKVLKQSAVSGSGKGMLQVDASTLAAGAYYYTLYIDGKNVGTKQMVRIQ